MFVIVDTNGNFFNCRTGKCDEAFDPFKHLFKNLKRAARLVNAYHDPSRPIMHVEPVSVTVGFRDGKTVTVEHI